MVKMLSMKVVIILVISNHGNNIVARLRILRSTIIMIIYSSQYNFFRLANYLYNNDPFNSKNMPVGLT